MTSAERVGANIRAWRLARNLTQVKLGELIESDGPRVGRLEKGAENPTIETLDKLAAALAIDVHQLTKPRPEEESGHGTPTAGEINPVLAQRWEPILEALDAEVPAADTWRGDVLKAVAALNRALRREDSGAAPALPKKAGR